MSNKIIYLTSRTGGLLTFMHESKLFDEFVFSVYSNRPNGKLEKRCALMNIPITYFQNHEELYERLRHDDFKLIFSAGYGRILPSKIVNAFPIINIHPGKKGYEGLNPQKRMLEDKVEYVGQFIHEMDESVDGGKKLFYMEIPNTFKSVEELDKYLKHAALYPLKYIFEQWE